MLLYFFLILIKTTYKEPNNTFSSFLQKKKI